MGAHSERGARPAGARRVPPGPRGHLIGTRELLIDAARKVITERGVSGATTKQIAQAAGCSEGTLYNHFADKRELVVAAMSEEVPAFVAFHRELPDRAGTGTVRGNLEELARLALEFYTEILPFVAPTFSNPELRERHRAYAVEHDRGPHKALGSVAEYLRRERRSGRVHKRIDPDATAMLLLGACFQYAALGVGFGHDLLDLDPDDFVPLTVRSLIAGLDPKDR